MGTPQTSTTADSSGSLFAGSDAISNDNLRPTPPEVATDPIVAEPSDPIPNLALSSEMATTAAAAINGGMVPSGYPGGKSGAGVFQKIINQMPPHDLYVEPFLGGGSVMFYKRPALRDIGVDINGGTIARARLLFPQRVELIEGDGIQYLVDLASARCR